MSIKKFIVSDQNFDMEDLQTGSSGEYIAAYNSAENKIYTTNISISGSAFITGVLSASSYLGLPDYALKTELDGLTGDYTNLINKPDLSIYALKTDTITSASYSYNSNLLDNRDSTTFAGTGSNLFSGSQVISGSGRTLSITSTSSSTSMTTGAALRIFQSGSVYGGFVLGMQSNSSYPRLSGLNSSGNSGASFIIQPDGGDVYMTNSTNKFIVANSLPSPILTTHKLQVYASSATSGAILVPTGSVELRSGSLSVTGSIFVTSTLSASQISGAYNYNNLIDKPDLTLYALKTDLNLQTSGSYVSGAIYWADILNKPDITLYALKTDVIDSSSYAANANSAVTSSYLIGINNYALLNGSDITGSFKGDGAEITGVISASYALTASALASDTDLAFLSGSNITGSFKGDGANLINLKGTNLSVAVPVISGGTGLTSFTAGALYLASTTTSLTPFTGSGFQLIAWNSSTNKWQSYNQPYDIAAEFNNNYTSGSLLLTYKVGRNIRITGVVSSIAGFEYRLNATVFNPANGIDVAANDTIYVYATTTTVNQNLTLLGQLR